MQCLIHCVVDGSSNIALSQVIAKHMTLGKDYSVVEPAIPCREGESVQVILFFYKHIVYKNTESILRKFRHRKYQQQ